MLSQKITLRIVIFLLVPLVMIGCGLLQANSQTFDEETKTYTTDLFSVTLPKEYLGAQPGTADVKVISDWMRKNGYDYQGFESFVVANSSSLLFTAYNTNVSKSRGLTQITLAGDKKPPEFHLEQYVDFYLSLIIGEQYELISHEQRTIGDKKVDIVVYNEYIGDSVFRDGVYIFETANRFWKFEFYTPQDNFEKQLPEFESIVLEFKPIDNK